MKVDAIKNLRCALVILVGKDYIYFDFEILLGK